MIFLKKIKGLLSNNETDLSVDFLRNNNVLEQCKNFQPYSFKNKDLAKIIKHL